MIIFCAAAALNAQTVLTVDDAVQLAMEKNLSLDRVRVTTDGKKRTADTSWNSLIPSLSASGSINHGTSITGDVLPGRDQWIPGFSLSANLTLSTATIFNITKAKTDYEAGIINYESAKQELELQVRKAFYQILLIKENIVLTEQNIATAQTRYDQTRSRAALGQVSRLDELSARVDLENLKPTLNTLQSNYENALDSMKQIMGLKAEEEIVLDGNLHDLSGGTVDISKSSGGLESYNVSYLRKSMQVVEEQRKALWNQSYIPSLSLGWTSAPQYASDVWSDQSGSFSVGLSFKLDNYLPWSSARESIKSLDDSLTNYRSQITEAVMNSDNVIRQYQRTIERSLENIDTLKLNVELARETYQMYDTSYKSGTADLTSLRSANDSLLQAENKVLEEMYNLLSATLDLEKELNVPFGTLWQN